MAKPSMTDFELGASDGFCGIEARYPHNAHYMRGIQAGHKQLMAEEPLSDDVPSGCSDAHIDQFYA